MATKSTVKKGAAASPKKAPATKAVKPAAAKKAVKPAATHKTTTRAAKSGKTMPSHEEISRKAHEVYLERLAKGLPGDSESDWHRALELLQGSK